jgi:hypothetical protein
MVKFIQDAFSDAGLPSASRILSGLCTATSCFAIVYYVVHKLELPDPLVSGGLAAFGTSHYAANLARNMFGKQTSIPVDPNAIPGADPNAGH